MVTRQSRSCQSQRSLGTDGGRNGLCDMIEVKVCMHVEVSYIQGKAIAHPISVGKYLRYTEINFRNRFLCSCTGFATTAYHQQQLRSVHRGF